MSVSRDVQKKLVVEAVEATDSAWNLSDAWEWTLPTGVGDYAAMNIWIAFGGNRPKSLFQREIKIPAETVRWVINTGPWWTGGV